MYTQRSAVTDSQTSSDTYPAAVLVGEQADFTFDALVELTLDNEKHMQEYIIATVEHPENGKKIHEDEERLLRNVGGAKAVVLDEVTSTNR